MMKYSSRGLAGTIIFHLSILLILLFFGFSFPDPPPEEQGVLVNFGTELTGLGEEEPIGSIVQGGVEEETQPVPEETVKIAKVEPVKQTTKPTSTLKNSQDIEEVKVKETKPTEEELKQLEVQKLLAEELRKKKVEEDRQRKLAEQWNTKGQNAFNKKGIGTTDGSQGITEGTGNQGDPDGMADVDNYGTGGGLGNGVIGKGLSGRGGICPEPKDNCKVSSKLIIEVQVNVNREGNVVGEPKIVRSTFSDECSNQSVIKAALSAKFTVSKEAPFLQQGTITYTIMPK